MAGWIAHYECPVCGELVMVRRETCPFCNNKIDCREDASEDGVDKSSDGRSFAGRLTKRLDDGQAVMDCRRCKMSKTSGCSALGCRNMVKERLAAYEDTGLLPEEIKEDMPDVRKIEEKLAGYDDAEANGLLVRLPCKVGGTIYLAIRSKKKVRKATVCMFHIDSMGLEVEAVYNNFGPVCFCGRLGVNVFTTPEEAEAALADDKE